MGSSNVARSQTAPFSRVPEAGKITDDVGKPKPNEPWHILKEDKPGSKMANGGCDVRPEPPLIVLSEASAGNGDGLTGEAGTDEIHAPQQIGQGQPGDVVQDGSGLKGSIGKPRFENAARVWRHFTVGDRTDGVPKFGK